MSQYKPPDVSIEELILAGAAISPIVVSRMEKAASDNGFDLEIGGDSGWLVFGSSHCPLRVWLGAFSDSAFFVAFSQQNVASSLDEYGAPMVASLPKGAFGGRTVPNIPTLHRLLRRAFQLSKALPDELLRVFERRSAGLPRSTEAERFVVQRVGQDVFRSGLLDYWEGRCALTGLAVPELLRASHIKPWAACADDAERLDVFNGLLLAAHFDAAFDAGLMTIADTGEVVISSLLEAEPRALLGLNGLLKVESLTVAHRRYLAHHRSMVFKS